MEYILNILYRYGMIAVCFVIMIEYACFPISSEIVLPFSGVVAKANDINLVLLIICSTVCGLIGCSICYYIGRIMGDRALELLKEKVKGANKAIDSSYRFFDKYGKNAVLIGRLIPLCRTYISFVAGALKQPYIEFSIYSAMGIIIWNTVLISLGYILGENWAHVENIYNEYKICIMIAVVLIGISILIKRIWDYSSRKDEKM